MNYTQLTQEERYQISALMKAGHTQKKIAEILNRHPSTILREVRRNKGARGYRPKQAQEKAMIRKKMANKAKKVTPDIYQAITHLIKQELSPEQTCDYLRREKVVSLHHETLYQYIYRDKQLGGNLWNHLRIARKGYRKRYGHYEQRGRIKNRTSIDERPMIVDMRMRVGDWEGDLIIGKNKRSALLTLVERQTLYTIIVKLNGKKSAAVAEAIIMNLWKYRDNVHTLTFDNGLEFADHETIAIGLGANIYFAHPYSSWERGTNENINGLIRQYFPKGTDFSTVTNERIQEVMMRLNNRPRKTRGGYSPNELFLGQHVDLLAA